jgi:hypothetical protein
MKLKRKNKLLLLGFIIALYICYAFAISNTLDIYKEFKTKNDVLIHNNSTPKLANQLLQKEKQLDKLLAKHHVKTSESYQNDLLKQLNFYSAKYNLKVIDFKEPHIIIEKNTTTSSYIFSLQGSFNGSIALLNKLENNPALGTIKHINFNKKRNYKSNVDELFVEVVLGKINM